MRHDVKSKLIAIILLILVIFPVFTSNIKAAINEKYEGNLEVVEDTLLEENSAKDSNILDSFAVFVYALASMIEKLMGVAFQSLTGSNVFPWADRILFNAVPLLDVNFFNPAKGSLFTNTSGDANVLASVVRNTYFTIFSIAIAFLGIIVAIAAIKMAISTIASEKAKYKEALTKWLFSIVMLFLIHNLISFVFYVNEKMVEVASSIASEALANADIALLEEEESVNKQTVIDNFLEANAGSGSQNVQNWEKKIRDNDEIAYRLLSSQIYREAVLFNAYTDTEGWNLNITGNGSQSVRAVANDIEIIVDGRTTMHSDSNIFEIVIEFIAGFKNGDDVDVTYNDFVLAEKYITGLVGQSDSTGNTTNEYLAYMNLKGAYITHIYDFRTYEFTSVPEDDFQNYVSVIISTYNYINGINRNSQNQNPDLIARLGQYFKTSAYTFETDDGQVTGWYRSKLTIQGALLYAIFVAQSILYFFSYLKRFFYIVVLAIMAPAIVLMDFLSKTVT